MIKVFYGENRLLAEKGIRQFLGENYEVVEGAELLPEELVNIFLGASLFAEERKILVRDLLANKAAAEKIADYVDTSNQVALLELKMDKRSNIYKALKDKVEFAECKMPKDANAGAVFDIFATAKRDGRKAVAMLEKIEQGQEPIMFAGLMNSQALKDYAARPSAKTKRVLKELAQLDMELKSSGMEPWLLIKAFLMRVGGM